MAKYEVQKGRTVTTRMGVAHEGGILKPANFTGKDDNEKQTVINKLVEMGVLKEIPLSEAEQAAILKAQKIQEEVRLKREAESERLRLEYEAKSQKLADAQAEKETAILDADFDSMNKDPLIEFSEKWEIELNGTTAIDIREELKALQESLTAPE